MVRNPHIYIFKLAILMLALALAGCGHYQLGTPTDSGIGSLFVETVVNDSAAPQMQALLTENLMQAFLRDGSVRLAGRDAAAATLRVVVSRYARDRGATTAGDTALARSYHLALTAEATLLNNVTGEIYFENRPVEVVEPAYLDDGLAVAEYDAAAVLAFRLATRIKDSVIGAW